MSPHQSPHHAPSPPTHPQSAQRPTALRASGAKRKNVRPARRATPPTPTPCAPVRAPTSLGGANRRRDRHALSRWRGCACACAAGLRMRRAMHTCGGEPRGGAASHSRRPSGPGPQAPGRAAPIPPSARMSGCEVRPLHVGPGRGRKAPAAGYTKARSGSCARQPCPC